jgi:hypothetical protein
MPQSLAGLRARPDRSVQFVDEGLIELLQAGPPQEILFVGPAFQRNRATKSGSRDRSLIAYRLPKPDETTSLRRKFWRANGWYQLPRT